LQQLNYAQILIQVKDKHDTRHLLGRLTGKPVGVPVQIRISGEDIPLLRAKAEGLREILQSASKAERVRDDWGADNFTVKLATDSDRANLAGLTNLDIASSSATGMNGFKVATLRERDKQIPVVARLRMEERSRLSDIRNLYVYASQGTEKVPLRQVSRMEYQIQTEKLRRLNQFRTITMACFPAEGALSPEVLKEVMPGSRSSSAPFRLVTKWRSPANSRNSSAASASWRS
jgi:multidrug efflux pump